MDAGSRDLSLECGLSPPPTKRAADMGPPRTSFGLKCPLGY